jgi:magnesium-transporting ATPase (P-type)
MSAAGFGVLFLLVSAFKFKWSSRPSRNDEGKLQHPLPSKKTKPSRPLRVQLMACNTITLFFFLLSIQEYQTYRVLLPKETISTPECKTQQLIYTGFVVVCCAVIVLYNYGMSWNALANANTQNLFTKPAYADSSDSGYGNKSVKSVSSDSIRSIEKRVKELKTVNGAFVAEIYPFLLEMVLFASLAILSVLLYVLSVLRNYGIIEVNMFSSCET